MSDLIWLTRNPKSSQNLNKSEEEGEIIEREKTWERERERERESLLRVWEAMVKPNEVLLFSIKEVNIIIVFYKESLKQHKWHSHCILTFLPSIFFTLDFFIYFPSRRIIMLNLFKWLWYPINSFPFSPGSPDTRSLSTNINMESLITIYLMF